MTVSVVYNCILYLRKELSHTDMKILCFPHNHQYKTDVGFWFSSWHDNQHNYLKGVKQFQKFISTDHSSQQLPVTYNSRVSKFQFHKFKMMKGTSILQLRVRDRNHTVFCPIYRACVQFHICLISEFKDIGSDLNPSSGIFLQWQIPCQENAY